MKYPCYFAFTIAMFVSFFVARPVDAADAIVGAQHRKLTLPSRGAKVQGFRCDIEIGDIPIVGYYPVRVTFKPIGTFPADRRFVVRVTTQESGQAPPRNGLRIDLPVTAAQGSGTFSVTRYVPKWSAGSAVEVSIFEDGRELKDYKAAVASLFPQAAYQYRELLFPMEQQINWVLINAAPVATLATIPELQPVLGSDNGFASLNYMPSRQADPVYWQEIFDGNWVSALGQSELPTDWRAYNNHDAVLVSSENLVQLRSNEAAFSALRDWLFCGGTVVVYETESGEQTAAALDVAWTGQTQNELAVQAVFNEQFSQWATSLKQNRDELDALKRYIIILKERDAKLMQDAESRDDDSSAPNPNAVMEAEMQAQMQVTMSEEFQNYYFPFDVVSAEAHEQELQQQIKTLSRSLAQNRSVYNNSTFVQQAGAGRIIGTTASVDDADSQPQWRAVQQLFGFRSSPMLRRGVDPMIGDRRFDRWIIAGVAQPPVYTFMGLLVVFVILVGPVAYRKTSKSGRSYLMFAIAPALAIATTIAMFTYGIVSDGFGTVARVRQLTFIDGSSGDGGERIRAAYFAGVRPGDGIEFPDTAEVMWYPNASGESWQQHYFQQAQTIGTVTIGEDFQRFSSAFLPSREQRQFVVHVPRRNIGCVQLVAVGDGQPPTIENAFDFPLRGVLIRDADQQYWSAESVAAGASIVAVPIDDKQSAKMIGAMYNDFRPIAMTKQSNLNSNYSGQVSDLASDVSRAVDPTNVHLDGVFEMVLQEMMQTSGEIPKDHFIAIADVSADAVAVPSAEMVDSVRYLFGTLPETETP